jgi:hypothetical protein
VSSLSTLSAIPPPVNSLARFRAPIGPTELRCVHVLFTLTRQKYGPGQAEGVVSIGATRQVGSTCKTSPTLSPTKKPTRSPTKGTTFDYIELLVGLRVGCFVGLSSGLERWLRQPTCGQSANHGGNPQCWQNAQTSFHRNNDDDSSSTSSSPRPGKVGHVHNGQAEFGWSLFNVYSAPRKVLGTTVRALSISNPSCTARRIPAKRSRLSRIHPDKRGGTW